MERGLFLTEAQFTKIENRLIHLHSRARALYTLLVDVSGQLISAIGTVPGIEPVTLAALAASNMAATAEMAKLSGEPGAFSYLFHEGRERNIYITAVGEEFLLVLLFDHSTQIGWVRLLAKVAAKDLLEMIQGVDRVEKGRMVGEDFGTAVASGLDQIFDAWD